jgi:hypothetical protein
MTLALACFFFGLWLGLRFKVAILVPATFVIIVVIWFAGLIGDLENSVVIIAQIVSAIAIQSGYLTASLIAARFTRGKLGADLAVRDYR